MRRQSEGGNSRSSVGPFHSQHGYDKGPFLAPNRNVTSDHGNTNRAFNWMDESTYVTPHEESQSNLYVHET